MRPFNNNDKGESVTMSASYLSRVNAINWNRIEDEKI